MKKRIIDYRPPKIAQLLVLSAAALHWATPLGRVVIYENKSIAVLLGLSGFGVMIWGWLLFKKFDAAICPTAKSNLLVTSGIYRFTRNPMYLGIVVMLLAIALFVGTLPFFLVTVCCFLVLNNIFCVYEENKLTEAFGETYSSYKTKVRRWF